MSNNDQNKENENLGDTKSGDSRRKLLDTAQKLFAEKGLDGVSTRDIAREAQVNVSLISYYFNGKEGLYLAILEDFIQQNFVGYKEMIEGFDLVKMDKKSFCQQMKQIITQMLDKKLNNPCIAKLVLRENLSVAPIAQEFMDKSMDKMAAGLIRIFEEAQKKGFLKAAIHPATLLFSLAQAVDMYVLTSSRYSVIRKRGISLENNQAEYVNQIYMIFIEGALT